MKCILLVLTCIIGLDLVRGITYKKPRLYFTPCLNTDIISFYDHGSLPMGHENQYNVTIPLNVKKNKFVEMIVEVDSLAEITLIDEHIIFSNETRDTIVDTEIIKDIFTFNFYSTVNKNVKLHIKGVNYGIIPYIRSIKVNNVEYCKTAVVGYLNRIVQDYIISTQLLHEMLSVSVNRCGRRKLEYNKLIIKGQSAKHGDWPWHVAIFWKDAPDPYKCGGTLITKLFVLTAAHCLIFQYFPLPPENLIVMLGKHNFYKNDNTTQIREVFSVIPHENYGKPHESDNDIALLKLKTEAVYTDYVQPACMWSAKTFQDTSSMSELIGMVVGWGREEIHQMSSPPDLKELRLPILNERQCLQKDPTFYGKMLSDGKKFCAGWSNGSSPCNGDSGGGLMVFVPDEASPGQGAWYLRGIVSVGKYRPESNSCDPDYYSVFTDTYQHESWILNKTLCSCFPPLARKLCSDKNSFTNMKSIDSC